MYFLDRLQINHFIFTFVYRMLKMTNTIREWLSYYKIILDLPPRARMSHLMREHGMNKE